MGDVEPFIAWLRARGVPDNHVEAHRHYANELAKHPSLTAAIRAQEEAGASAQSIANLRQTAARLVEFDDAKHAPPPVQPRSPPERAPAALEIEPRDTRPAVGSVAREIRLPRHGCQCRERHDVYLDNDFGSLASMLGGGLGIGTYILIRFVGVLGALAIALGLAGLGGLATIVSICIRCGGCRRAVHDLDADERASLRKGRALVTLVTVGLVAGAAVCGYLWWTAVQSLRSR